MGRNKRPPFEASLAAKRLLSGRKKLVLTKDAPHDGAALPCRPKEQLALEIEHLRVNDAARRRSALLHVDIAAVSAARNDENVVDSSLPCSCLSLPAYLWRDLD